MTRDRHDLLFGAAKLILDFHNTVEDIKDAFDPFYTSTALSEPTDVNVLHDLKDALDDTGIYDWPEVIEFNEKFFASVEADQLSPIIDTVAERFDEVDEEQKPDIKIKAKQFVKIYAQVACIIPFTNANWEMLHWFLKFLIPKLKVKDPDQDEINGLLESVDLTTYGLERVKIGYTIGLDDSDSELEPPNPNPRSAHDDPEKDPLDLIIAAFNERYFTGWDATPEEQRVTFTSVLNFAMNDPDFQTRVASNADRQNRSIAAKQIFEKGMRQQRAKDLNLYRLYASDETAKDGINDLLLRMMEHVLKSNDRPPGM